MIFYPGKEYKTSAFIYRVVHLYPDGEIMYVLKERRTFMQRLFNQTVRGRNRISTHKISARGFNWLITKGL